MVDLSLAMPMYNEEGVVEHVVTKMQNVLEKRGVDYELVIVNNGSKDRTGEILEELCKKNKRLKVVHVKVNQGYGWGVISGLKACKGDVLGYSDGDGQVSSDDIVQVYEHLLYKKVDFCRAIRNTRDDGLKRKIASFFFNNIFSLFFFRKIVDVNAKPKFFTRKFYNSMDLKSKDWFIDSEILIYMIHKPFKSTEMLVESIDREAGKSNVALDTVKEFLVNMAKWRIALWKNQKL